MPIKRYIASKDSTITNAFKENFIHRAKEANMGASDVLEVYSIYSQKTEEVVDDPGTSRVLIDFPVDKIRKDRESGVLPLSGNVQFMMKMFNTPHPFSLPYEYHLSVSPLSQSWDEGRGLDMEYFKDVGAVNWISATSTTSWNTEGGDFYESLEKKQFFEEGPEDLEIDITDFVESWLTGSIPSYGLMVKLSSSHEQEKTTFYTKKFFARGTQYFYKKPCIEARFDATVKDDRNRFYNFNPFVDMEDNLNTLYIYNRYKGSLKNLRTVGTGSIYVRLYSSADLPLGDPLMLLNQSYVVTGSWVSTGIYKAEIGVDTLHDYVYDIWFDEQDKPIGYGGKIEVKHAGDREENFAIDDYIISITNLKQKYSKKEEARFQVFVRKEQWNPNSYTSVLNTPEPELIDNMYYSIRRTADDLEIVPYGTGSFNHTRLSYDKTGNYFDLDMSLFEPGYTYEINFCVSDMQRCYENKDKFKFRVE